MGLQQMAGEYVRRANCRMFLDLREGVDFKKYVPARILFNSFDFSFL